MTDFVHQCLSRRPVGLLSWHESNAGRLRGGRSSTRSSPHAAVATFRDASSLPGRGGGELGYCPRHRRLDPPELGECNCLSGTSSLAIGLAFAQSLDRGPGRRELEFVVVGSVCWSWDIRLGGSPSDRTERRYEDDSHMPAAIDFHFGIPTLLLGVWGLVGNQSRPEHHDRTAGRPAKSRFSYHARARPSCRGSVYCQLSCPFLFHFRLISRHRL